MDAPRTSLPAADLAPDNRVTCRHLAGVLFPSGTSRALELALQPALRRLLMALPELAVTRSLDWPEPPSALQRAIQASLRRHSRLDGGWQRLVPPRGSRSYSERPTLSYGASFHHEPPGPPPQLQPINRPRWQGRQRRIGLTGGIASGKSSAGRLLAEQGLPLLDADVYAREALAPGSPAARAVVERYGRRVRLQAPAGDQAGIEVCGSDPGAGPAEATIDRAALGRIVFGDQGERRWLEGLVHPLVRARFEAEMQRLAAEPQLVLMIPLLFEVQLDGLCSEVWLVDCDPAQQLQRLIERDGLSAADARARIAAQWPMERKRALADVVIDNRGAPAELKARVAAALADGGGRAAGSGGRAKN